MKGHKTTKQTMSVSGSQVSEEEEQEKVKATVARPDVRHQLQVMVTGKLADRGISTTGLWNSRDKPKDKLTEQEQERLDRQRYNKRKWAQKDRARSKALLNSLKQANGVLEYKNQQLKREVNRLQQKKLSLKNILLDHDCQLKASKKYIYAPFSQGWTKDKVCARDSQKTGGKHSLLALESVLPFSGARKEDSTRRTLSHCLTPVAKTGFIAVDEHLASQRPCASHQARQSERSKPCFRTVINLAARHGMSTDVQKVAFTTENPAGGTELKSESENVMSDDESPSSDPSGGTESVPSLTSGGFIVSELSDISTAYLQMLQGDEGDADMTEDPSEASKKRKGRHGQRNEDSGSPPEKRTRGNVAVPDGLKSDDLMTVLILPPAPFRQNWVKSDPDVEKRHRTADFAGTPAASTIVTPYRHKALERQSGSSTSYHTINQRETKKPNQANANTDVSHFPRKSEHAFAGLGQHKTRKGALMERWFAQEQRKGSTKKIIKTMNTYSVQTKTLTQIIVNPWAVGSPKPPDTDQRHSPASVTLGLNQTPVCSEKDSDTDASNGAVMSSVTDMRLPVVSSIFGSSFTVDVSTSYKSESESSAAASATSHSDTEEAQDLSNSQVFKAADMSSAMDSLTGDVGDLPIPNLTNEGSILTRRMSWPSDDAQPQSCPASRPRCLSLPSKFSDVIFDAADSGVPMFFTNEQLLEMLSNPEETPLECLPMLAAGGINLLFTKPNSLPDPALSSNEADEAPRNIPLHVITGDSPSTPSTPSSPSPRFPFDLRLAPVSKFKDSGSTLGRRTADEEQRGVLESESVHLGEGTWEKGQAEGSRVKVERVPDADIPDWHVLYELPLLPEQMDSSTWQTNGTL